MDGEIKMNEEKTKCKRTFFHREENGLYKKIIKEVPCIKKRCANGKLARPGKDGRVHCKDDREEG